MAQAVNEISKMKYAAVAVLTTLAVVATVVCLTSANSQDSLDRERRGVLEILLGSDAPLYERPTTPSPMNFTATNETTIPIFNNNVTSAIDSNRSANVPHVQARPAQALPNDNTVDRRTKRSSGFTLPPLPPVVEQEPEIGVDNTTCVNITVVDVEKRSPSTDMIEFKTIRIMGGNLTETNDSMILPIMFPFFNLFARQGRSVADHLLNISYLSDSKNASNNTTTTEASTTATAPTKAPLFAPLHTLAPVNWTQLIESLPTPATMAPINWTSILESIPTLPPAREWLKKSNDSILPPILKNKIIKN